MPVLDEYGRPFPVRSNESAKINEQFKKATIQAAYDAAQNNEHLRTHWQGTDNLSPDSANKPAVRKVLRERSRYELIENNAYLNGAIRSVANDMVGSGASPKLKDPRISPARRRFIERLYENWAKATKLRKKSIRMRIAKITDGEAFTQLFTNPWIRDPVKLDLNVFECDRCTTENFGNPYQQPNEIDGIKYDEYGNPVAYYLLKTHPGDEFQGFSVTDGDWFSASVILHWYRQDRGWHRGIPELVASLPLCALLRRYTIAVVLAAEAVANHAIVLESEAPPNVAQWSTDADGNPIEDDPFDVIPYSLGMMTTLPWGYKMNQIDAKQPMAVFDSFVDTLLREILRPLMVPFGYGVGSSDKSNMSSQTIDIDHYKRQTGIERMDFEETVLDPVFDHWWREASRIEGYLDGPMPLTDEGEVQEDTNPNFLQENPTLKVGAPIHEWAWDPPVLEHTDPQKVAAAIAILHDRGIMLDGDVQRKLYNRTYDEWQSEYKEQVEFRQQFQPQEEEPDKLAPKISIADTNSDF